MNTSQINPDESISAATELGQILRRARKKRSISIAVLAQKIGRTREWLNRVELGYCKDGITKPPTSSDLQLLANYLGSDLKLSMEELLILGDRVSQEFYQHRKQNRTNIRNTIGKLAQTEIIFGENQVSSAINNLLEVQPPDAILRNTGVKNIESYARSTVNRNRYGKAIGEFLAKNPNSLFKRIEYVSSEQHLNMARLADERLAGGKQLDELHNARVKFRKNNPFHLHVLIGENEAIMTFPQNSAQSASSVGIIVRDKSFIEALRTWYDHVLWDSDDVSTTVDFAHMDESFERIKDMYSF